LEDRGAMSLGDYLTNLGSNERVAAYSRRNRSCHAGALVSWTPTVHRARLALSLWPLAQGSFLVVAQIRGAFAAGRARWPRYLLLRSALRARMVRGRCAHCDHGHLADCGEMVAVSSYWFRVTMKLLSYPKWSESSPYHPIP